MRWKDRFFSLSRCCHETQMSARMRPCVNGFWCREWNGNSRIGTDVRFKSMKLQFRITMTTTFCLPHGVYEIVVLFPNRTEHIRSVWPTVQQQELGCGPRPDPTTKDDFRGSQSFFGDRDREKMGIFRQSSCSNIFEGCSFKSPIFLRFSSFLRK